ncbi:MAG TPA: nucleoside transporter C-terminal domain-containing protein [Terriglobales bacterium]|nr:nucleoside transporter C-terminal domain-containing protein [Terriglobales bacterium]
MGRLTGIFGLLSMVGLAYLFSTNRKAIRARTVAWGLALQIIFAFLVLRVEFGRRVFAWLGDVITRFLGYSYAGSTFLFGDLGKPGQPVYIAFKVLPTIIFVAAFFAILYHYGIMQFIIRQMARVMMKFMGTSGAESLNVAASIFLGCTEAPLTIRPFLPRLTRSEMMTIMTSGMAHISGAVMAAYIAFGIEAKHLLAAVIMTAPGTLLISKMLVPETENPVTAGRVEMTDEEMGEDKSENLLGAVAKGTTDGLYLTLNVAAMLISFLALIALADGIMGGVHNGIARLGWSGFPGSFEQIFGVLFAPVAWVIGIPRHDVSAIGSLLGTRMILNEFVAFSRLAEIRASLDPRSYTIATYALCGFANLGNIGIEIGGIGSLAPNKRGELARLGIRAMLAGTMANLMSASIAGMLL